MSTPEACFERVTSSITNLNGFYAERSRSYIALADDKGKVADAVS